MVADGNAVGRDAKVPPNAVAGEPSAQRQVIRQRCRPRYLQPPNRRRRPHDQPTDETSRRPIGRAPNVTMLPPGCSERSRNGESNPVHRGMRCSQNRRCHATLAVYYARVSGVFRSETARLEANLDGTNAGRKSSLSPGGSVGIMCMCSEQHHPGRRCGRAALFRDTHGAA